MDTNEEKILRSKLIKLALLQYNKRFEKDKVGHDSFDDAGFVWYIYNEICKIDLFEESQEKILVKRILNTSYGELTLYKKNSAFKNLNLLKTGDILFFDESLLKSNEKWHCGIYLKNNEFIHCSTLKKKVTISNFEQSPKWEKRLVAKRDILSNQ